QPISLPSAVDPCFQRAHRHLGVANEAVASAEPTLGRHAEIGGASAARVGPMRTTVDLAQCIDQIGEWVPAARDPMAFEFIAANDHLLQHDFQVVLTQFATTAGSA